MGDLGWVSSVGSLNEDFNELQSNNTFSIVFLNLSGVSFSTSLICSANGFIGELSIGTDWILWEVLSLNGLGTVNSPRTFLGAEISGWGIEGTFGSIFFENLNSLGMVNGLTDRIGWYSLSRLRKKTSQTLYKDL